MTKPKAKVMTTDRQINAALARARRFGANDRRVIRAKYEPAPDLITLYLDDGIRISLPRTKLQGLQDAKAGQLAKIELLGGGTGLHWPLLDVDHYVPGLLSRVFGTSRWMAELGRRGGSVTTKAKAAAARANGRKGGRPKRSLARSKHPRTTSPTQSAVGLRLSAESSFTRSSACLAPRTAIP